MEIATLRVHEHAATADADLAARRDESHAHIRSDFQQIADALSRRGRLRAGLTAKQAADAIYALANPTTYLLLVDECGWGTRDYREWLRNTLRCTLTGRS